MDVLVTFILLLGCWTAHSSPSKPSAPFSMVFSTGTQLLVDVHIEITEDDYFLPLGNNSAGSSEVPSIQILKSTQVSQHPDSPHLLVCLLKGLKSPQQHVLWWIDDAPVTSAGAVGPWAKSEWGYSATSVWEVLAADWRPTSSYWCGTIQKGRVYRQKLCSED